MARAPHESGGEKTGGDDASFVRDIVSDPKNVPDVMLLYGYMGASSEEGHDRLYLSPDLRVRLKTSSGIAELSQHEAD
jgi:hypothetical protein